MVRIPRCGRGDLGSNPSSHTLFKFFLSILKFLGPCPLIQSEAHIIIDVPHHNMPCYSASMTLSPTFSRQILLHPLHLPPNPLLSLIFTATILSLSLSQGKPWLPRTTISRATKVTSLSLCVCLWLIFLNHFKFISQFSRRSSFPISQM